MLDKKYFYFLSSPAAPGSASVAAWTPSCNESLASVKQVLLNTCPKPDEKRLNAMWHSRPRGRRKMNLESPGRGGAGVWVD